LVVLIQSSTGQKGESREETALIKSLTAATASDKAAPLSGKSGFRKAAPLSGKSGFRKAAPLLALKYR
jgi:hypothetical protein